MFKLILILYVFLEFQYIEAENIDETNSGQLQINKSLLNNKAKHIMEIFTIIRLKFWLFFTLWPSRVS